MSVCDVFPVGLGISTQALPADHNNPVTFSMETSSVKQFLHLITVLHPALKKYDKFYSFILAARKCILQLTCCSCSNPNSLRCGQVQLDVFNRIGSSVVAIYATESLHSHDGYQM